ncbi:hypothetical protein P43SY_003841 [Pythium insidiosum]|uniref:Transcription factor CBF/NF-Y/archaeal histone domain-containing protein n=1 Tax=Pythium insidiosum TaxID=114742 RepID=A0AAD5LDC7_PYTIN|nr:hypothetical protein P43SY_003841 [Pythium insidiosum]
MEQEHAASLTARAVKQVLPDRAIVTKDARVMMNTATSMFTLYLTSFAHEASVKQKRGTITLKDVLSALRETEFDHFIEPIEQCLQGTKAADAAKRARKQAMKDAVDASAAGAAVGDGAAVDDPTNVDMDADAAEVQDDDDDDQADALTGEESVDEDTAAPGVERDAIDGDDSDEDTERPEPEEDDLPMDEVVDGGEP